MKKFLKPISIIFVGLLLCSKYLLAQNVKPVGFSSGSIDIGIVVKDVELTANFYSEAIGLKEIEGFNVPREAGKRFGLTDGDEPLNVRVFLLGEAPNSAKLKVMSFPNKRAGKSSQKFIHSTLGFSYLTIFVEDMTESLNRLNKANVKLLGETPASIGENRYLTVFKDPDGNYFELIGPMN
ncbi:MAG: VOC family protein [Candidatus Neomarinimicrobiota bacterium]|nr:VOC family protein [Candidatus Neomarinimicrobiota bacterium]